MTKKISMAGLADFMTASPLRQRSIVHTFKYPKEDESRAKILYYREARDRVAAYHGGRHPEQWLRTQASTLETLAMSSPKGRSRTRLRHNARGLEQYAEHFAGRSFEVQKDLRLAMQIADVKVTVSPDLHVLDGTSPKMIKLNFGMEEPSASEINIVRQTMLEAAEAKGLGLSSAQVLLFDVPRGKVYKGARFGTRTRANIEAACQNISAIWDTI